MTRQLGKLTEIQRLKVTSKIHAEAEAEGWHTLSNQAKGKLYKEWEARFNLKHSAVKDQIMKGFDAAQHVPPSGEAAVHERIRQLLAKSQVPYWAEKKRLWEGRGVADFVLGLSEDWVTVVAELESAVNWQKGLQQAIWYRAAYIAETGLHALPCMILFGDATGRRWEEISNTCSSLGVLILTFELQVDGGLPRNRLDVLLGLASPKAVKVPEQRRSSK